MLFMAFDKTLRAICSGDLVSSWSTIDDVMVAVLIFALSTLQVYVQQYSSETAAWTSGG